MLRCGGGRPSAPETGRVFALETDHVGIETYDDLVGQIASSHHWIEVDGHLVRHSAPYRYVWPSELDLMARIAGLRLRERWAGWDRTPFMSEQEPSRRVREAVLGARPADISASLRTVRQLRAVPVIPDGSLARAAVTCSDRTRRGVEVELLPDRLHLVGPGSGCGKLHRAPELAAFSEEDDVEEPRVGGLGEGVGRDHTIELLASRRITGTANPNRSSITFSNSVRSRVARLAAMEHDVAALNVSSHILESGFGQCLPEIGHGHLAASRQVDAAQQGDVSGHHQQSGPMTRLLGLGRTLSNVDGRVIEIWQT